MDDAPRPPRPGGMTELEERLLAASVHRRLFSQPAEVVTIGRYRVLGRLGQGGMGVVFSAHDDQLDRRVAIKLLHAGQVSGEAQARLRREALALGRLSHPNVVGVYEIGEAAGQLFVAMELVEGVTLQAWLGERPRRAAEIVAVYVQAGQGLAAAHAGGLVHRDFKPDNVLIGRDGRVRVVDFGLARHALAETSVGESAAPAGDLDSALTATGALLGTPAYMAPEQVGTAAPIDARSDQFGFCVALYEALYGERPFGGATLDAYVMAVAAGAVRAPPPSRRVPRRLRRALLRGLRYAPHERWPDMQALLAALTERSRAWLLGVAALVVALALGLAWALVVRARASELAEREVLAQARVDAIAGELAPMLAAGEVAAAERRIADLVAAPEVRGTEAAAVLWLRWAELLAAQGRPSATAWAHTYARTRDAAVRGQALLGLARSFDRQREATGLAHALALLTARAPELADAPEVTRMRFEVAAHHRDLAAAQRLAAEAGPTAVAVAPVLAALARGRPYPPPADPHAALHHPSLRGSPVRPPPIPFAVPGGERMAIDQEGEELRLLGADGTVLARWPTPGRPIAAIGADLDGDAAPEVLVGIGNGDRGLLRLERGADGAWRPLGPLALAGLTSGVTGLAVADLDGDARLELIAALGQWRAYDVRVLRPTADGALAPVARRKLGIPIAVAALQTPRGPRIAALILHAEPSPLTMPPDRVHGVAPGVHLLRLEGDTLALERSLPLADNLDAAAPRSLLVGDLDGDGLDDLVVGLSRKLRPDDGDRRDQAIDVARQLGDGSFARVRIAGVELVGAEQLDDDAALELVLVVDDAPWAAGLEGEGSTELPPSVLGVIAGIGHARELARGGASPEVLALDRAGLSGLALSALRDSARSAEPSARRRLHFVGAALATEQGDHATARALLEDAADEPDLRADALWQLARDHERRGDLTAAIEQLDRLLGLPAPGPTLRTDAAALRTRLVGLAGSRQALPLLFSRGERASWSALAPAQLRADPVARTLAVEAASALPPAVTWPLRWDGQRLLVELALRIDALEWGSTVQLRLVDEHGAPAWRIGLGVVGGGGVNNLVLIHQDRADDQHAAGIGPIPEDGAPRRLLLRIEGTTASFGYLDGAREVVKEIEHALPRPFAAGTYRLELTADPLWAVPEARARVRIDALEVAGAEVPDRPRPTGVEQAAALLVDGETHDAAALLGPLAAAEPRARLWLAIALAELGAADRSAELLRQTLADAPGLEPELVAWLRTRTAAVAPIVRRAFGLARHLELVERAWTIPLSSGLDPGATRALRSALAGIDEACDAGPRCSPMLHALGRAHIAAFDLERAHRAFTRALADDPPPAEACPLELDLAALEATRGDPAAARVHAGRALALAPAPEITRDMLRARPELQSLLREPGWQALLAIDDGLP